MLRGLWETMQGAFGTEAPDGWFDSDLLWFSHSLTQSTWLARGASLELPDLKTADTRTHEAYYEALGAFLCGLGEDEAVQFQWRMDSDYHGELEAYRRRTEEAGATGWCERVRRERYTRYRRLLDQGRLRRERLELYLAKRASGVPREGFRAAEQVDRYLGQCSKSLGDRLRQLEGALPGARVSLMDNREHFHAWRRFCQPGLRLHGPERLAGFDPAGSLLDNCWPGGGISSRDSEGNIFFRLDGHYHTLLVLRRWPMETHFGIIWSLTGALAGNFCYTLACLPRQVAAEVNRTEEEMRKLRGFRKNEQLESLDDVLARKKARISALQGGFARPFSVLPVVRVWDSTLPGLLAQVQALKIAITTMGGAQCYQVEDPVQAKHLFYETLPGWTGGRYRDWDLFALAGRDSSVCFLQDLVPLSSSYVGHLEEGEALYDGEEGNLAGLRSFANGTPQHAVMIGTTRVGKSSQTIDYLSQSDCFFGFRGIIEEGLSYGTLVQLLGGESFLLHPDADLTLNYFDTQGQSLTRSQVAAAAGLLLVMSGKSADPDQNLQRKALFSEYLEQLYADAWNDLRLRRPELELEAAKRAVLGERRRLGAGAGAAVYSVADYHAELGELACADPGRYRELLAGVGEGEAMAFARRPSTASQVRDAGFAFLAPGEFPTHTAFVEMLRYGRLRHHDKELVDRLASRLSAWQRQGPNGRLFDGVSNRRLDARLVHFELGLLPSSNPEMKEAAVFLIANQLRQRIVSLPRTMRKQFIFEEPSRYLKVGGMEELLAEFYAQMGKFRCQIMPVTQQYGQLARSSLRPVIFGNSKQYFLFRQNDRQDLDDIGDACGLPEAARNAIRRFSAPEYQVGDDKYSQMAVFAVEGEGSSCGVVRNRVTREMLYVSDSSGERHDARTRALATHGDVLAGVIREAARELAATAGPAGEDFHHA